MCSTSRGDNMQAPLLRPMGDFMLSDVSFFFVTNEDGLPTDVIWPADKTFVGLGLRFWGSGLGRFWP